MEPFLDWYAILGVSRDASTLEITKAFRAGAKQWHPDVNTSPEANARFRELKSAHEVLSDPEKREAYDSASRLRMKQSGDQSRRSAASQQAASARSGPPEPNSIYIIEHFAPGRAARVVIHHTTYSLTSDEVARLMQDGMLRGQLEDRSTYLLMYCVHCHALIARKWVYSVTSILFFPYEIFPVCPHCQKMDWCPAEDAREQREKEEKARREREELERKPERTAAQWLQEGNKLLETRNYPQALAAYEQALLLNPNDAAYKRALSLNPNDAIATSDIGLLSRNAGQYEEGLAMYERALLLDPNDATTYNRKGEVLGLLERYEEALAAYERALFLDPQDAEASSGKGEMLSHLKRYEEALAACEQSLRLDPYYYYTYTRKKWVLGKLGRDEEAKATDEQEQRFTFDEKMAASSKRAVLTRLKRSKAQRQAQEKAQAASWAEAFQRSPEEWLQEGNERAKNGDYQGAREAYKRILLLNPNYVAVLCDKGETLWASGRYNEALAMYEQALALKPANVFALSKKGSTLHKLKRYAEALAVYERALLLDPNNAASYSGKGCALYVLERYKEALIAHEHALRLEPGNSTFAHFRAQAQTRLALSQPKPPVQASQPANLKAYHQPTQVHPYAASPRPRVWIFVFSGIPSLLFAIFGLTILPSLLWWWLGILMLLPALLFIVILIRILSDK